jgi:uncharacterized membrane protein
MSASDAWEHNRKAGYHVLRLKAGYQLRVGASGNGWWQWEAGRVVGVNETRYARGELRGKLAEAKAEAEAFAKHRGWLQ